MQKKTTQNKLLWVCPGHQEQFVPMYTIGQKAGCVIVITLTLSNTSGVIEVKTNKLQDQNIYILNS